MLLTDFGFVDNGEESKSKDERVVIEVLAISRCVDE